MKDVVVGVAAREWLCCCIAICSPQFAARVLQHEICSSHCAAYDADNASINGLVSVLCLADLCLAGLNLARLYLADMRLKSQ